MTFQRPLALVAALLISGPVLAGSPDTPGEQGDIVATQKGIQQSVAGAKNGWGQAVSDRARNGSGSGARNLGEFLNSTAGGPNPDNDNGGGND